MAIRAAVEVVLLVVGVLWAPTLVVVLWLVRCFALRSVDVAMRGGTPKAVEKGPGDVGGGAKLTRCEVCREWRRSDDEAVERVERTFEGLPGTCEACGRVTDAGRKDGIDVVG